MKLSFNLFGHKFSVESETSETNYHCRRREPSGKKKRAIWENGIRECKVVIAGATNAGKTSFVRAWAEASEHVKNGEGEEWSHWTLYAKHADSSIPNNNYTLNIASLSGEKDFAELRRLSYYDTDCVILAYNISDRNSFIALDDFYNEVISSPRFGYYNTSFIMAGFKSDLRSETSVTYEEGKNKAKELNISYFIEVSTLDHLNGIENNFQQFIDKIMDLTFHDPSVSVIKNNVSEPEASRTCILF